MHRRIMTRFDGRPSEIADKSLQELSSHVDTRTTAGVPVIVFNSAGMET